MENKMVPHTLKVKTIEKYHKCYCDCVIVHVVTINYYQ